MGCGNRQVKNLTGNALCRQIPGKFAANVVLPEVSTPLMPAIRAFLFCMSSISAGKLAQKNLLFNFCCVSGGKVAKEASRLP